MSKTLTAIAEQLRDANKKVQLIYAFNGLCCTKHSSFRLPPSAKDSCFYSDAIFF